MTPSMLRSTRKCWPSALLAQAEATRGCVLRRSARSRLGRLLSARLRRARRACGRRTPARSAGRGPAAGRGTARRSRRGSGRREPVSAAKRRSTAFGKLALPANETYQPRSSAVGSRCGRREAVEDDGARVAVERGERVVVRRARVDDDRLAEFVGERELLREERAAAPRAARSRGTSRAPSPPRRPPSGARAARGAPRRPPPSRAGLVRMRCRGSRRRRRAASASARGFRRPSSMSVPTVRIRVDAGGPACTLDDRVGIVERARGARGCRSRRRARPRRPPGRACGRAAAARRAAGPGGSTLGCPAADPARVVAGEHLVGARRPLRSTLRNSSGPAIQPS